MLIIIRKGILMAKDSEKGNLKSLAMMKKFGFYPKKLYSQLSVPELVECSIQRDEAILSHTGSLSVETGKFTGRSPDDRYIVQDKMTTKTVNWGKVNHPISEENFNSIFERMKKFVKNKEIFLFNGFVGSDEDVRLPISIVTDRAWQSIFANQIFIKPTKVDIEKYKPKVLLVAFNDFKAIPKKDGTSSETFIVINLKRRIILIGSTSYAGEIKKSIFSLMNYYLPEQGIFPMHCSSNVGKNNDSALFFGLSGTGKTTLSADSNRFLIGDDEHGWSSKGIFNFEGGCYAKCINLKKETEPQIWNAIKFGSVMENVVVTKDKRIPDFSNGSLTENTRVVYPLEFIPGAVIPSLAGHPKVIVFLTADAFGVMPPIAKLSKEGAMYHFMSGYTSKLAGTERGITQPKETFSQCFGAPFMPLHATKYAEMLGNKITQYNTKVYLINTGWYGGPYGIGKRIDLKYTRSMVTAVINGSLMKRNSFKTHQIFNLDIPLECPGVPNELLDPVMTWDNQEEYFQAATKLANLFIQNFEKFGEVPKKIIEAGPQKINL
jgi:phosphoenolpyruvate carboxykinase (ATP)